jgi:hypothetical protein
VAKSTANLVKNDENRYVTGRKRANNIVKKLINLKTGVTAIIARKHVKSGVLYNPNYMLPT